ncbi:hypothetical protein L1887_38514 [Cichorium endivia]|nr:hypothetical protein L1887_38514 [Cichorium endivia]
MTCLKCKANEGTIFTGGEGGSSRFCADCFHGNLYGKFKLDVTSHAMISPTDKVRWSFIQVCEGKGSGPSPVVAA